MFTHVKNKKEIHQILAMAFYGFENVEAFFCLLFHFWLPQYSLSMYYFHF